MSASTQAKLINPEVITVNQDSLGIQSRKWTVEISEWNDIPGQVVVTDCSTSEDTPLTQQWVYHPEDKRCLSIENCSGGQEDNVKEKITSVIFVSV